MGLAASQARYLALTARKSNVEFEGQMVNQQRTELANQSANIYQEYMNLKVPTAPSTTNYYKTVYDFTSDSSSKYTLTKWEQVSQGSTDYNCTINYTDPSDTSKTYEVTGKGSLTMDSSGRITKLQMSEFTGGSTALTDDIGYSEHTTTYATKFDEEAYNDAQNQWKYEQALYEQKVSELSAKTEKIQVQDRSLELQLRQLDTEQDALSTEMESVKKVIEKNVEQIFKTFQS